jgi:hypothetical protein
MVGRDADGVTRVWAAGGRAVVVDPDCPQIDGMMVTIRSPMVVHEVVEPYAANRMIPAVTLHELSWMRTQNLRPVA